MNLERQVRRRLLARPQTGWLYPGPGCTDALADELRSLLASLSTPDRASPTMKILRDGIVTRHGRYRSLLELALRTATAQDITLTIAEGPVHDRQDFERLLGSVVWEFYFKRGDNVVLRSESHASSLYHKGIITECVTGRLAGKGVSVVRLTDSAEPHRLVVKISHNRCRVEISLAGLPLWRRGYRAAFATAAPLREDLAQSAIRLSLADSRPSAPPSDERQVLLIPFAGSGTLLYEYLIARYLIPPFIFRSSYAFERFPCGVPPSVAWVKRKLMTELGERVETEAPRVARLIDTDPAAIASIGTNWGSFSARLLAAIRGTEGGPAAVPARIPLDVEWIQGNSFSRPWREWLPEGAGGVFLPLNPPYGIRLATRSTDELYHRIGEECQSLARSFAPDRVSGFILCPTESSWRAFAGAFGAASTITSHFSQGGRDIRLCRFRSQRGP